MGSIELDNELYTWPYCFKGQRDGKAHWEQVVVLYAILIISKQQNNVVFSCKMPDTSTVLLHTLSRAKELWCIDATGDSFLLGVN